VAEEEQMKQTSNAQRPTPNFERLEHSTLGVERSALDVRRLIWRILDFALAGIFIYAGVLKAIDPVNSPATSTITNFCRGPSVSRSRFIFRGWKFSARSGLCFDFYIVARCRF
jgi:hypothetical protein